MQDMNLAVMGKEALRSGREDRLLHRLLGDLYVLARARLSNLGRRLHRLGAPTLLPASHHVRPSSLRFTVWKLACVSPWETKVLFVLKASLAVRPRSLLFCLPVLGYYVFKLCKRLRMCSHPAHQLGQPVSGVLCR